MGYLTGAKLVLASTKDFAHRLYLRDGIFAEITLSFRGDAWASHHFTFPDFKSGIYDAFLKQARDQHLEKQINEQIERNGKMPEGNGHNQLPIPANPKSDDSFVALELLELRQFLPVLRPGVERHGFLGRCHGLVIFPRHSQGPRQAHEILRVAEVSQLDGLLGMLDSLEGTGIGGVIRVAVGVARRKWA